MTDPAAQPRTDAPTFASPSRQCDVVMKGGITSGIVYPPLMLDLAETYRFRSIGGTSAGAIAAAVTAAAEYGREREGFEKLQALNAWLGTGTHLLDLFQASRATRPLLTLLLALERRGRKGPTGPDLKGIITRFWSWLPGWVHLVFVVIPGALRDAMPLRFWLATALGAVAGGAVDVALARGIVDAGHPTARTVAAIILPVMFIGSYLASVGACAWRLWRILSVDVPAQGFGICTGLTSERKSGTPALTDWLHERIQDLAGLDAKAAPLTVGALRATRAASTGADVGIELRMITTSLSLGRSTVLPIEDEQYLFREDDMRRLFPGRVVDHLVACAPRPNPARPTPAGYRWLPPADAMPVLVLARMSLSFPVLLSAVPLYVVNVDGSARPEDARAGGSAAAGATHRKELEPKRVWFSDGGLTSNFPIHFFDAWLPSRPTFGVNLTTQSRSNTAPRAGGVSLPAAERPADPELSDIISLPDFLGAIWTTTQNFRDNTLAALPGYRDRIVQIPLSGDEGGLNLAMGPEAVHHVMQKGDDAGDLLLAFDFDRHRWVRFLSFMAQFEHRVLKMGDTIRSAGYDRLIEAEVRPGFPYYRDAAWRKEALERLALLQAYVASVQAREQDRKSGGETAAGGGFFERDAPMPEGVLRITPRE